MAKVRCVRSLAIRSRLRPGDDRFRRSPAQSAEGLLGKTHHAARCVDADDNPSDQAKETETANRNPHARRAGEAMEPLASLRAPGLGQGQALGLALPPAIAGVQLADEGGLQLPLFAGDLVTDRGGYVSLESGCSAGKL